MIPPDVWIPDRDLYQPRFSPWLGGGEFGEILERVRPRTLVSEASCHTLYTLARQAIHLDGELWECGVYMGGSAMLLAEVLSRHGRDGCGRLRLFDTFDGSAGPFDERYDVPYPRRDERSAAEAEEASLSRVERRLAGYPGVRFHPGFLPDTFAGLEDARVALAHVDVNYYRSVLACCAFLYGRLAPGGFMVFDDYGYASCPGTRRAVDEFFRDKPEVPLVSPTAQAIVFKLPGRQTGVCR